MSVDTVSQKSIYTWEIDTVDLLINYISFPIQHYFTTSLKYGPIPQTQRADSRWEAFEERGVGNDHCRGSAPNISVVQEARGYQN